jgi:hypothetical protein
VHAYDGGRGDKYYDKDKQSYVFDWLKVEMAYPYSNSVKFYADMNSTGKSRKLYMELYSGQEYAEIKVLQK